MKNLRPRGSAAATFAVALALVAASAAAAASAHHGNPTVYLDLAPGDAGSAPDIFTSTISNTLSGEIDFSVVFANRTSLGPDDILSILIDADKNAATGDQDGSDFIIQIRGTDAALARLFADGHFEVVAAPSLHASWDKSVERIAIASSDLGNTTSFSFYEQSFVAGTPNVFDDAPDGTAVWDYTLRTPHIAEVRAVATPARPRAATSLHLTVNSAQLDSGETAPVDSITCRGTIGSAPIRGTGTGGCTFTLPASSRGKTIRVAVTAHVRDQSKTVTYLERIR